MIIIIIIIIILIIIISAMFFMQNFCLTIVTFCVLRDQLQFSVNHNFKLLKSVGSNLILKVK